MHLSVLRGDASGLCSCFGALVFLYYSVAPHDCISLIGARLRFTVGAEAGNISLRSRHSGNARLQEKKRPNSVLAHSLSGHLCRLPLYISPSQHPLRRHGPLALCRRCADRYSSRSNAVSLSALQHPSRASRMVPDCGRRTGWTHPYKDRHATNGVEQALSPHCAFAGGLGIADCRMAEHTRIFRFGSDQSKIGRERRPNCALPCTVCWSWLRSAVHARQLGNAQPHSESGHAPR